MPSLPLRKPFRSTARFCAVALLFPALTTLPLPGHATPEPEYRVGRELGGDIEIRHYAGYAAAELIVPGPAGDAGRQAFPVLAGYLFGKNQGDRKLAMTAPVTQAAVPAEPDGTAPAGPTAAPGGFLVQFVLPEGLTAANAPAPLDPRIRLRDVSPADYAVIRYSGFWSDANYADHLAKLQTALRAAGLAWTGEAVYSRYDAPFVPWFLRRNEIWLRLNGPP